MHDNYISHCQSLKSNFPITLSQSLWATSKIKQHSFFIEYKFSEAMNNSVYDTSNINWRKKKTIPQRNTKRKASKEEQSMKDFISNSEFLSEFCKSNKSKGIKHLLKKSICIELMNRIISLFMCYINRQERRKSGYFCFRM